MPTTIAENIDRLCTVEMRAASGNLPRGYVHHLYDAARTQAGEPLTYALAGKLLEHSQSGRHVVIVTGAGGPPVLPRGEVDGIPGAAALAKALHLGLGYQVIIVGERRIDDSVRVALAGCGLNFRHESETRYPHAVTFIPSTEDDVVWEAESDRILNAYEPAAVIAIEKLSPNLHGVMHSVAGIDCSASHSNPALIFQKARERDIFTAGIGDGGNEVGFGNIQGTVRALLPSGARCLCPCEDGMAAAVTVDALVVAAISDWGAYGTAALLAFMERRPDLLLTEEELETTLRAVVAAGSFDGTTSRPTLSDDGVALDAQLGFLRMLHTIVSNGLSHVESPGHDKRHFTEAALR
ncbi:glutamate cyclase domain-containing protein [Nonomuraea lactucae]|uniref:glutamate cyclase domain-containing protein n=1 Tax=Nonomuraea lactucae TaxID=2249762 RepID=UPI000DE408E1|nr:glutamate cyclase domain-containing protein [Nonomuraea lactucae]